MCGRYALLSNVELLVELFHLTGVPQLEPRYNIAPTQTAPVIRLNVKEGGRRQLDLLRWGLVPHWATDPGIGSRMINARAESAAERPAFRPAMQRRRCLVPADGFYEWKKLAGGKRRQPYFIRRADGLPFVMAGLWEYWRPPEGEAIVSFTILTTKPNELIAPLHDRMPVILEPEEVDAWLDREEHDPDRLRPLLDPIEPGLITMHPVSPRMNSARFDDPLCIEPAKPLPDDEVEDDPTLF